MSLAIDLEEDYLDEDEIDLIKLVSSSADVTNQYIVFEGSNKEYYAINVAKVEELFVYNKEDLIHNNTHHLIKGIADIRSQMTSVVCFDDWFCNEKIEENLYEILIFCYFSAQYIGLVVKQVVDIVSIMPNQMQSSSQSNELTTFVASITLGKNTHLCTIFDTDKLLFDLYGENITSSTLTCKPIASKKLVLFADDSRLVRKMAHDSFERLGVDFKIFEDGEALLTFLKSVATEDIGIFLLDIEMPRKTGIDVINALQQEKKYLPIPIIVHTNMANSSITDTLYSKNVTKIIGKVDFETIESSIREYML